MQSKDLNGTKESLVPTKVARRDNEKSHYLSIAVEKLHRCANSAVKIIELYRCQCGKAITESTQKKLRNLLLYTIVEEADEVEPLQSKHNFYLHTIETNLKEAYSKLLDQEEIIHQLTRFIHNELLDTPVLQTKAASLNSGASEIEPHLLQIEGTQQYPSDSDKIMVTSATQKTRFDKSEALTKAMKSFSGTKVSEITELKTTNVVDHSFVRQLPNMSDKLEPRKSLFDRNVDYEFDQISHRHDHMETDHTKHTSRQVLKDASNYEEHPLHKEHTQAYWGENHNNKISTISSHEGSQMKTQYQPLPDERVTCDRRTSERYFRDLPENWLNKLCAMLNNPHTANNWHTLAWKLSIPPYLIQSWSNSSAYPNPTKLVFDTWKVRRETYISVLRRVLCEMGREDCVHEVDDLSNRLDKLPN